MDQAFQSQLMCLSHPQNPCKQFTYSTERTLCLVCPECIVKQKLPLESLVNIDCIQNYQQDKIISNWPPLTNKGLDFLQIINQISPLNEKFISQKIEQFFQETEETFIKAIRKKKKEVLREFSTCFEINFDSLIKEYCKIACIDEIKNIFTSQKNGFKINSLLQNIILNLKQNEESTYQHFKKVIDQVKQYKFDANSLHSELQDLTSRIENMEVLLVDKNVKIEFNQQEINKNEGSSVWNNEGESLTLTKRYDGCFKSVLSAPILKGSSKYIMRLTFINHSDFNSSIFFVSQSSQREMLYKINSTDLSISAIRGKYIWSKNYYKSQGIENSKKVGEVELRIHLGEKYIKILDYPNYENSIIITKQQPICDNAFQIQIFLYGRNDSISINLIKEVSNFPLY